MVWFKPRVETHKVLGVLVGVIFALVGVWVIWLVVLGVQQERVLTRCSVTNPGERPPSSTIETELELLPPRYYCVYRNSRGEVLARIRAS